MLRIHDNYSITGSFISKQVNIIVEDINEENKIVSYDKFTIVLQPCKAFYLNEKWSTLYNLFRMDKAELQKLIIEPIESTFQALEKILFKLSFVWDRYRQWADIIRETLPIIIPDIKIDFKKQIIKIDNLIINDEIWDYIWYVVKLSCGEKVSKPITFTSEEAKKLWEQQQEYEKIIQRTRAKGSGEQSGDALMKAILSIVYSFPTLNIDYLFNQTMAQIHWLQTYAAGAVSYQVNAQAYAAGNVKKGKKIDFFIK